MSLSGEAEAVEEREAGAVLTRRRASERFSVRLDPMRRRAVDPLRFTSCQAPVAEAFCATVAAHVGERLGIAVEFVAGIPWQERLRLFAAGTIHVCWMCGLPYVWRSDRRHPSLELLAAPVGADPRYGGRPVYFSDVAVRRESPWSSFADLAGAAWAYNEETSHSGYNATRHRLARMARESADVRP
jgi:phosphonate transport system substrate-binding protein